MIDAVRLDGGKHMTRRWKLGVHWAAAFAILLTPLTSFGQGGVSVISLPPSPDNHRYHYQRFFALTPKGQVYVLQFDTETLQLIQSNQPVWSMPGVTAIAPAYSVQAASSNVAGSFFAITSDRRIYYVDASSTSGARARLISTDAPADKTAIGYFGCRGTLYTIPASGLLTTRTLGAWDADKLPTLLSAPIQAGTGWNNVSSPQCVETYGNANFNQVYATDANGVVVWYRQSSPGMSGWTQRNTNLRYLNTPGFGSGVHVFGFHFVLEARHAGGAGATLDKVTQGVRATDDFDGVTWPQGRAYTGVVTGGANLLDFSQVVDDGYSGVSIG